MPLVISLVAGDEAVLSRAYPGLTHPGWADLGRVDPLVNSSSPRAVESSLTSSVHEQCLGEAESEQHPREFQDLVFFSFFLQ